MPPILVDGKMTSGEKRMLEWPGLTALHTLFLRLANRKLNVHGWPHTTHSSSGEQIGYGVARAHRTPHTIPQVSELKVECSWLTAHQTLFLRWANRIYGMARAHHTPHTLPQVSESDMEWPGLTALHTLFLRWANRIWNGQGSPHSTHSDSGERIESWMFMVDRTPHTLPQVRKLKVEYSWLTALFLRWANQKLDGQGWPHPTHSSSGEQIGYWMARAESTPHTLPQMSESKVECSWLTAHHTLFLRWANQIWNGQGSPHPTHSS
jgi:hypothetical protein